MLLTYEEWYERTAAMLFGSGLPESFVEDCLTNREAERIQRVNAVRLLPARGLHRR